jgi:hypothetical protein
VNPKGGRDNPIGEGSGEDEPGWGIRRRPTLRFEDEGRSTTPDPLATEPPRDAPDYPEAQATPILFDGQAAGYRLGRRLSGSDDVYQAVHPRFEGRLVIKLFRRARGLDARAVDAFLADTSRTSSLRHPHVVQVVDAGVLRDGTPFVVTELLSGLSLEHALEEREGLITSGALPLVRGMASALTAAHTAGVVHRELRPDNVFIAELAGYKIGFAKLMDFGGSRITAALADESGPAASSPGASALGGRWCLAPEQWRSGVAAGDASVDQFALAAIAYRLLSPGRPPLARSETGAIAEAISLVPRVPALDAALARAMRESPGERFESVAAFFRAFEDSVSGATAILPATSPAELAATTTALPTALHTPVPAAIHMPTPTPVTLVARPAPAPVAGTLATGAPPSEPGAMPGPERVSSRMAVVQPTDDAVFPPSEPTHLPLASLDPALEPTVRGAKRRQTASGPRSLTQQFFVEGERQEATRFKNALFERVPTKTSLEFDSFDRVPRRRRPLWVALCLVGAIGASVLVAWKGFRLPAGWVDSSLGRRLSLVHDGESPATTSPPQPAGPLVVPTSTAASAPEVPPSPSEPSPPPAGGEPVAGAEATPPLAAAGVPPVAVEAQPATAGAGQGPEERAAAPERPAPPEPRAARAPESGQASDTSPADVTPGATAGRLPAPQQPRNRVRPRSTALHGYIWSPEQQQMVPAQPAWPPPAEAPSVPVDNGVNPANILDPARAPARAPRTPPPFEGTPASTTPSSSPAPQ